MSLVIDYLLQDTQALIVAVDNNKPAMAAKGFSESMYSGLTNSFTTLKAKEAAQQKAVKLVNEKTAEQNETAEEIVELIQRVKNSAKSAFGNNSQILKSFKVGERITPSVPKLRTTCEYLTALVLEHHDVLLQNGLTEEDIALLNSSYGKLVAVDASQENAKKLQVAATIARDEAADVLKDKIYRVRNFAKACFATDKEILVQFKPIAKLRDGKAAGEPATPTK